MALAITLAPETALHGAAGHSPFRFLSRDFNARALALAGAYTALAADASAVHYNPAGLARLDRAEASFMHAALPEGVSQEQVGIAHPKGWGADINYLDSGPILRTTISRPDGTQGQTRATDLALAGGLARRFGPVSGGIAVKMIKSSVAEQSALTGAVDLGTMWRPAAARGLTVAFTAQNLGPGVKYEGSREPLPMAVTAGAGWSFGLRGQQTTLSFDLRQGLHGAPTPSAGGEIYIAHVMPLRVGLTRLEDGQPRLTAGVGWLLGSASVDYGIVPFSGLGMEHRVSAAIRWGVAKAETSRVDYDPEPADGSIMPEFVSP